MAIQKTIAYDGLGLRGWACVSHAHRAEPAYAAPGLWCVVVLCVLRRPRVVAYRTGQQRRCAAELFNTALERWPTTCTLSNMREFVRLRTAPPLP